MAAGVLFWSLITLAGSFIPGEVENFVSRVQWLALNDIEAWVALYCIELSTVQSCDMKVIIILNSPATGESGDEL